MPCYIYDVNTGEYKGTLEDCTYVSYPYNFTTIPPPEYSEYNIPVFDPISQTWILYADYRGTWYNKRTKEQVVIENIGEVIDLGEFTNIPCPNPDFYYWDETISNWSFDINLYKQYVISKVEDTYNEYINKHLPISKVLSYVSVIITSKSLLDTNPNLLDSDVEILTQIINDSIQMLIWNTNVAVYKDQIINSILLAATVTDIDNIYDSMDFEQFTSSLPPDSLASSLINIQNLLSTV